MTTNVIECRVCFGTDFLLQDGRYVCKTCLTESQEHGFETVVDEETLGTFSGAAASLKRKTIGIKKKKRDRFKCYTSFTSVDAFTFILKAWTEEAVSLGIGGPSLQPLVHQLWSLYLKKLKMAYCDEPTLGPVPCFRDVQVALTGRKKLISPHELSRWKRRRCQPSKKEMSDSDDEKFDDDDDDFSSEARRRRSKKRRKFFDSFVGGENSEAEASNLSGSNLNTSTTNTSFLSTTFDWSSLGNLSSSFVTTSELELESECSEDDPRVRDAQNYALERLTIFSRQRERPFGNLPEDMRKNCLKLQIRNVFGIFALGLLLHDESSVSTSDICYFVDCDSISYYEALVNIPSVMVLVGRTDRQKFMTCRIRRPLRPMTLRRALLQLGSLLHLRTVNLNNKNKIEELTVRYVREFSLPYKLTKMIRIGFKHTELFSKFHFEFPIFPKYPTNTPGIPDPSVRSLALILICLKYFYGLDDVSEYLISENARKINDDDEGQQQRSIFEIAKWLKLSRLRAFLLSRYSPVFHRKFSQKLFPSSEMTHGTFITDLWKIEESFARKEINKSKNTTNKDRERKTLDQLDVYLKEIYGENLPSKSALDLGESLTPLTDFTNYVLDPNKPEIDDQEPISTSDKRGLRELLTLHESRVALMKTEGSEDESRELKLNEDDRLMEYILQSGDPTIASLENKIGLSKEKRVSNEDNYYNRFKRHYWILKFYCRNQKRVGSRNYPPEINDCVLASVPESYGWILKYFCSVTDISEHELHSEVVSCEQAILMQDPRFFGKVVVKDFYSSRRQQREADITSIIESVAKNLI